MKLFHSSTVIFIDSQVEFRHTLLNDLNSQTEVVILNSHQDGVEQITEYLATRTEFSSIHIVSHGAPASLNLGNSKLSLETISKYTQNLSQWLTKEIFIYGCNVAVGDAGEEFITKLHQITGAAIAASNTLTGNSKLGGDWNLAVTRGEITSQNAFSPEARQAYAGVLATYVVDIVQDTNDEVGLSGTSLREAINAANQNSDADEIIFNPSLNGQVINLTLGELRIRENLTIRGNKFNPVAISGRNESGVFEIGYYTPDVTLANLKIINGNASYGGGINNRGNLTIINTTVSNNQASYGGGIYNNSYYGSLKLINSTINNNIASNYGGGIYNDDDAQIINTTISSNSANFGGGIYDESSTSIFDSTITRNTSLSGGAGIGKGTNTTSTLSNTIVAGNYGSDVDYFGGLSNSLVSSGNNLIGTGNAVVNFGSPGDKTGISDPLLGPLTNNPGGTPTHNPLNGSPVINAGSNIKLPFDTFDLDNDNNTNERIPVDQTGDDRIQDGVVDIGAVESSFQGESPPQLSLLDATVKEGNSGITFAVFPIQLSKAFNQPITLKFSTFNGTAVSPTDFVGVTNQTLVIPAYQTKANLNVAVRGDLNIEQDETFTVRILSATNATLNDSVGIGKIVNDEVVSVSLDKNITLSEGNYGTKTADFVLRLSKPSAIPVRVTFNTLNGTATNGNDFFGINRVINFAPNQTTAIVRVPIRGDLTFEANETFSARISNPVSATIGKNQVTAAITNDDLKPKMSISDAVIGEGNSGVRNMVFNVRLSNPSSQYVSAFYNTINGGAGAPLDYNAQSGQVTFAPGQVTKPVYIRVRGDKFREGNEVFYLQLSGLKNANPLDLRATGTILNDDYQNKALVGNRESFTLGQTTPDTSIPLVVSDTLSLGASTPTSRVVLESLTQPDIFSADFASGFNAASVAI